MYYPKHFARATGVRKNKRGDGTHTVKRYGWSDVSYADAVAMANEKLGKAIARTEAGRGGTGDLYDMTDEKGAPICEPIVKRQSLSNGGEVVFTRNRYGSVCMNQESVAFLDVDYGDLRRAYFIPIGARLIRTGLLGFFVMSAGLIYEYSTDPLHAPTWISISLFIAFMSLLSLLVAFAYAAWGGLQTGVLTQKQRGWGVIRVNAAIEKMKIARPSSIIDVYDTPAGWRILILDALVPASEIKTVSQFFNVDHYYLMLCERQNGYRARVTPKPWNVQMSGWQYKNSGDSSQEVSPDEARWLRDYNAAISNYSAFGRPVRHAGRQSGREHPICVEVKKLHDQYLMDNKKLA